MAAVAGEGTEGVDVLEKLWKKSSFFHVFECDGDALLGTPLTGVQKGVLQGTQELPLRLEWL